LNWPIQPGSYSVYSCNYIKFEFYEYCMIKLRNAQFADYVAIATLHAENWRQNYRDIMSDQFLNNEVEQDRLAVWLRRLKFPAANQQVIVATLDEQIVGFCCVYLNDDPKLGSLLDNLHVASNTQSSGIGTLLMKECAKLICNKANSRKMYLWVYQVNEKARKFYERLGGTNLKTVKEQTSDGKYAQVCAYIWNDVSILL
jgi:ribosomal protein S18 acetylase RimI-like enzyme